MNQVRPLATAVRTDGIVVMSDQYQALKDQQEAIIDKMTEDDYKSGTRETNEGTKSAREVYGEQYDRLVKEGEALRSAGLYKHPT